MASAAKGMPTTVSFRYPREAVGLPLAELTDRYQLGWFFLSDGRIIHAVECKKAPDGKPNEATEVLTAERFIRLIKLAANGTHLSLHHDVTYERDFQLFARSIPDVELVSSKLHRAIKKATYLAQGILHARAPIKRLSSQYWQEALLPFHPSRSSIKFFFERWKASTSRKCFEVALMLDRIFQSLYREDLDFSTISLVTYLHPAERSGYAITFEGGKVFSQGRPLQSESFISNETQKAAIYVILPDPSGPVMYVGPHIPNKFHHSSFNGGQPVICAGEIYTDAEGAITQISNRSGHYGPGMTQLLHTLEFLEKQGVDLAPINLVVYSNKPTTGYPSAAAFLNYHQVKIFIRS